MKQKKWGVPRPRKNESLKEKIPRCLKLTKNCSCIQKNTYPLASKHVPVYTQNMVETKLNRSEARKLYWSKIPKEERKRRASHAARAKSDKMTPLERSEHGRKMIMARLNKKNGNTSS